MQTLKEQTNLDIRRPPPRVVFYYQPNLLSSASPIGITRNSAPKEHIAINTPQLKFPNTSPIPSPIPIRHEDI